MTKFFSQYFMEIMASGLPILRTNWNDPRSYCVPKWYCPNYKKKIYRKSFQDFLWKFQFIVLAHPHYVLDYSSPVWRGSLLDYLVYKAGCSAVQAWQHYSWPFFHASGTLEWENRHMELGITFILPFRRERPDNLYFLRDEQAGCIAYNKTKAGVT